MPRRRATRAVLCALFVAAFVGGGALGVVRYIQTYWLYRGFSAPVHLRYIRIGIGVDAHEVSVIPGTVESIYLRGPTIGHFRDQILVYLPPGYREHPFNRYPVLYLLHGVPGDPQNFLDIGDVATISDDFVATRQIRPMIIVMPSGGRSFFQDNEWANLVEPNEGWDTFVSRDLVHLIDQRYRTHGVGRECGIAGDSEGAYGALNIAFHHVGEFDLIEGWSPYYKADTRRAVLFGKNKALIAYNSPGEEIVNVAPSLRRNHAYIWLYDGTKERINEGSAQFAAALGRLGVAHAFTQYPGHHDWSLWRAHMPSALITASNYFSHGEPTTA